MENDRLAGLGNLSCDVALTISIDFIKQYLLKFPSAPATQTILQQQPEHSGAHRLGSVRLLPLAMLANQTPFPIKTGDLTTLLSPPSPPAHGCELWDLASRNPEVNGIFNEGMACTSKIVMRAILSHYKDGFNNIRSLVDAAGGIGGHVAEIVRAYPHIKGINLDLPHVVATAPKYEGVSHVAGNMFDAIPNADAIRILHDWNDESCVEILRNCKIAIPEKTGKLIIADIVLKTDDHCDKFDDIRMAMDLVMFALTCGKERTEQEWKKLLEEGGFSRYKIIKIPALESIIEAYPE
ncbi:hypothetical protein NC652_031845 [Populus alba x Populus x berolinensis]|nr:hypothetical protein NC652_031845 [Populus alba x Populus x berolinensis]